MTDDHKQTNLDIYDAHAERLAKSYNSVETPQTLPALASMIERYRGDRDALDIGCGSGIAAHWLCEQGWRVDAVDGSAKMIAEARKTFTHDALTFLQDTAPDFPAVVQRGGRYDLVLMSAFLFHFDADERQTILKNAVAFLKPESGLIHLTLRHGPPQDGRNIFDVGPEEISLFAGKNALACHIHGRRPDFLGRSDVSWTHLSLWFGNIWDFSKDFSVG